MLWCTGRFELLSEGGQRGRGTNHIRESIPHSGSIKRKTITKLFDRFVNGGAELWNGKEITTTLTVPGAIRTAVRRKDMEQNTCESLCEDTYKQVWLS